MFNVITDTIERLKKAQQEAEELYIQTCEAENQEKD